jgi:hypothetical protein
MALPAKFSLLHSEFNEFLFAQLGEEENGSPLSVLSALTRLGADPWTEGARLSALPRDAAAQALVPMIAMFPRAERGSPDVLALAERLAGLLPQHPPAAAMPPVVAKWRGRRARISGDRSSSAGMPILAWIALAVCAVTLACWLIG